MPQKGWEPLLGQRCAKDTPGNMPGFLAHAYAHQRLMRGLLAASKLVQQPWLQLQRADTTADLPDHCLSCIHVRMSQESHDANAAAAP
jgi:hypothetical protein